MGTHSFFEWWVLAFFQSWNPEGLLLLCSKLFLLSLAHIYTIDRGGDQNMQGIECYALKIFKIEKTPTPHDWRNFPKNASNPDFFSYRFPFTIEATCG